MISLEGDFNSVGAVEMSYRPLSAPPSTEVTARILVSAGHISPQAVATMSVEQTREYIKALELAVDLCSRRVEMKGSK